MNYIDFVVPSVYTDLLVSLQGQLFFIGAAYYFTLAWWLGFGKDRGFGGRGGRASLADKF